jgi:hypothetical protein
VFVCVLCGTGVRVVDWAVRAGRGNHWTPLGRVRPVRLASACAAAHIVLKTATMGGRDPNLLVTLLHLWSSGLFISPFRVARDAQPDARSSVTREVSVVVPASLALRASHPLRMPAADEDSLHPASRLRDYVAWFMTGPRLRQRVQAGSDGNLLAIDIEWEGTPEDAQRGTGRAAVQLRFTNGMVTTPMYMIDGLQRQDAELVAAEVAGTSEPQSQRPSRSPSTGDAPACRWTQCR